MVVGIHQPHYFPWMGYFDKMAKSDLFILLDGVQMEKGSYMYRNRILNKQNKIAYLTISGEKHGYLEKKYSEIQSTNDEIWLLKHKIELERAYSSSAYFNEVWETIEDLFNTKEDTICKYCIRSIYRIKEILGIYTKIVMQSQLPADDLKRKNDLVINLCQVAGGDEYLSGNGARSYADESDFEKAGIKLHYQHFTVPQYQQLNSTEFVPGLSMLDVLFNCGIEKTKDLFWAGRLTEK